MPATIMTLEVAFPLRVVAYPAPDLPGVVIAHALDLDILAQGPAVVESWTTLQEAILEMIAFRLSHKLPPVEWSAAPEEVWQLAEAAGGEKIDRAPPELTFHVAGIGPSEVPQPQPIIAERAPAMAHAC